MSQPAARVIADSIAQNGKRITTLAVRLWRPLLVDFNTHKALSRNSPSSRAMPARQVLDRVHQDPFIPKYWLKNKKGMQGGEWLPDDLRAACRWQWLGARDNTLRVAHDLIDLDLHKGTINRLLEPFMTTEIVCTATEFGNFLALRTERDEYGVPMADPHFADVADDILRALNESEPRSLFIG